MKTSSREIIAVHLFNDYSGSPRVLAQWLNHAVSTGRTVKLYTSDTSGVLDSVESVDRKSFRYRPRNNRILGLFSFLRVQLILLFQIWRTAPRDAVVYVNTILPFGAILGARLAGVPVLCHVHEVSVRPRILNAFLKWIVRNFAHRLIFVSDFVRNASCLDSPEAEVIPNALAPEFMAGIQPSQGLPNEPFRVLLLGSVRAYKGLNQFVDLAKRVPNVQFEMVLNGNVEEIRSFFDNRNLPDNLTIWPTQSNVHPFYARANLVLNLSLPDRWIETFGLTALEAMAYGLPVIVPPVGGIADLVEDGIWGFHCDPYDLERLVYLVERLQNNREECRRMGEEGRKQVGKFSASRFVDAVDRCIGKLVERNRPMPGQVVRHGTEEAVEQVPTGRIR